MTGAPRVLVLTPSIDGADGVSEVSRQAVAALASEWGADAVEVWALDGARGGDPRVAGVAVRCAAGGRARIGSWALALARTPLDDLIVVVLHAHLAPVALVLAMRGARVAVFLHGIEAWTTLRRREAAALARAEVLAANSQYTARRFRDANPRFADRDVAVCHLGIGVPHAEAIPPPIAGYALIVGRLASAERYKGHDRLIDAWPAVLARVPDAHLVIAGDGDDRPRLEALVRNRGLDPAVTFTGRVPAGELAGWYRQAAFFVMPSTGEGFGLTYLEAMRAGKPCIASPGAAEEIIDDEITGLIVDPASRPAIVEAIVRFFTDAAVRSAMGIAAGDQVVRRFDERHFAVRLLGALAPLASAHVHPELSVR